MTAIDETDLVVCFLGLMASLSLVFMLLSLLSHGGIEWENGWGTRGFGQSDVSISPALAFLLLALVAAGTAARIVDQAVVDGSPQQQQAPAPIPGGQRGADELPFPPTRKEAMR